MNEQQNIIKLMKKQANKKRIEGIQCIFASMIIFFLLLYFMTHNNDKYTELVVLPFFICPIIYVSLGFSSYYKGKKILKDLEAMTSENEIKE